MTYYLSGVALTDTYLSNRAVNDKWQLVSKAGENYPYVEQAGQQPSAFSITPQFVGTDRYSMVTSIKAEITKCEKVLLRSTDKYLHGNKKYVWLAQAAFNITESGGKLVKGQLTGDIDPYQIHSCDFTTAWTGTSLSLVAAHNGRYAIRDTIASPVGSTVYSTIYDPDWTHDLSEFTHLTFWLKNNRASTAFTAAQVRLQTSTGNYYYWNLTFCSDTWTVIDCDLTSPDGTVGSPSLATTNQFIISITATDTTVFNTDIDNIRTL